MIPFTALDISLSISAGARLLFFSSLLYALKVGSETLPPIQESLDRRSRAQRYSAAKLERTKKARGNTTNSISISNDNDNKDKFPNLDLYQGQLATSLTRLNLLVATWPLLICLGQNVMMRPARLARPDMLLLSALFAIKGYRLSLWPRRMDNTTISTAEKNGE